MKSLKPANPNAIGWLSGKTDQITGRTDLRVFKVEQPVTVFIHASRCQISIQYHELEQVELHARFYHAFGLRFVTQQDEAGVYIVVKRRRLLGWISRAEFLLKVPPYANLTFNLTPGAIRLDAVNGILELPPLVRQIPTSIEQLPPKQ